MKIMTLKSHPVLLQSFLVVALRSLITSRQEISVSLSMFHQPELIFVAVIYSHTMLHHSFGVEQNCNWCISELQFTISGNWGNNSNSKIGLFSILDK